MEQIASALGIVVIGVLGCVAYFYGSNLLLDRFYPANAASPEQSVSNLAMAHRIRPWLFLGPALLALTLYLIYPAVASLILSFQDKNG